MRSTIATCLAMAAFSGVAGCTAVGNPMQAGLANIQPVGGSEASAKAREMFRRGEYALAIEAFRRQIREAPDAADGYNGMAACYDMMNRFDLSEKFYQMALARAPMDGRIYRNMARSLAMQGRQGEGDALLAEWDAIRSGTTVIVPLADDARQEQAVAAPASPAAIPPSPDVGILADAAQPEPVPVAAVDSRAVAPLPVAVAAVPRPVNMAVAPQPAAVATAPGRAGAAIAPPPVSMTPKPRPISVAHMSGPVNVAVAPQPAAVATAPGRTGAAITPSPVSGAPKPRPISVALTSRPLSVTVAPRPVGFASATLPIRLMNATGRRGLARQVQRHLAQTGVVQTQVGDSALHYRRSWVLYPVGQKDRALAVQKKLPFRARILQEARASRIIVLLGANAGVVQAAAVDQSQPG